MSDELFLRYGKLVIKNDNKEIDLSDFQYSFTISARMLDTPKTLDIRIFNLNKETVKLILDEGLVITLDAGYITKGNYGNIFTGQIVQIRTGKQNGVDTFIDITAQDGDRLYNDGFISYTLEAGSNSRQRLNAIYAVSDMTPDAIEITVADLWENELPRGRVYYGRSRDYMRSEAAKNGADFKIEDNSVYILGRDEYLNPEITHIINAETGMIGLPQQTIDGIQVRTLLNPKLKAGQRVELNNDSIQQRRIGTSMQEQASWFINHSILDKSQLGYYKIIAINHNGDNRGPNWYTDLICNTPATLLPSQLKYTAAEIPQ